MKADILLPYGECETRMIMISGATYTVWQFIVFLVPLQSYPDGDRKSGRNVLVINNM
jgi:hypothetical protein